MNIVALKRALKNYEDRLGEQTVPYLEAHFTLMNDLTPEIDWFPADEDAVKASIREGGSVFDVEEPTADGAWFAETVEKFVANALEQLQFDEETEAALGALDFSPLAEADLTHLISDTDAVTDALLAQLVEDGSPAAPVLKGALVAAAQTYGYGVGHKLKDFLASFIFSGDSTCPTCGTDAALGIIEEGRRETGSPRYLWCSMCDTIWRYPRVKCVRCGSAVQAQLHYYFAEDDEAHRVHHCEACGGITPIVHEGKMRLIANPQVEELVMLPLMEDVARRLEAGEKLY